MCCPSFSILHKIIIRIFVLLSTGFFFHHFIPIISKKLFLDTFESFNGKTSYTFRENLKCYRWRFHFIFISHIYPNAIGTKHRTLNQLKVDNKLFRMTEEEKNASQTSKQWTDAQKMLPKKRNENVNEIT